MDTKNARFGLNWCGETHRQSPITAGGQLCRPSLSMVFGDQVDLKARLLHNPLNNLLSHWPPLGLVVVSPWTARDSSYPMWYMSM
jgi:hypothetical protein